MKLIEKLAEKASSDWFESNDCYLCMDDFYSREGGGEFDAGFRAGFRKAREMAANMCRDDVLGGYGYRAAQDILMLGEEDV